MWIGIHPSRHAREAQQKHSTERDQGAAQEKDELKVTEPLIHQAAGDFGKPEVKRSNQRCHCPTNQDKVDMAGQDISVCDLKIDRHRRKHNARKTADKKKRKKRHNP
jgi:hypothetical protein